MGGQAHKKYSVRLFREAIYVYIAITGTVIRRNDKQRFGFEVNK